MNFIDHYRPISRNWFFWLLIASPLFIGLILGALLWSRMDLSITADGYSYFLKSGALPIGVMGLAFPLGGIFGLVHKSKQLSQQLLDYRLHDLYSRSVKQVNSIDAVLILLCRLINHVSLLNSFLLKTQRNHDHIKLKVDDILSGWSSFYSEPCFTLAMRRLTGKFEEVDAIMCGYEKGIRDYSENPEVIFSETLLNILVEKMSNLEQEIRAHREEEAHRYKQEANDFVRSYGFVNASKQ